MAQTKKPLVFRDRNTKEKIPYYVKTEDVQLPDGTDIETKLAEMEEALDGAADGTVKSVTLNGTTVEPDANGDVELTLPEVEVDDTLDEESGNAVSNAAVTTAIEALRTAINSVLGEGSSTAIENFQEVLDFLAGVTDEETLIGLLNTMNTAIGGKVAKSDVYNGLDRTTEGKVLDARQGKALNDLISALQSGKSDKNATVSGVTYDTTSHKLKQTINGTTSDVANVDTAPTANSDNFVTSGGVSTALATLLSNIHIGTNGNWWVGPETDPNNDTGIKAQGPKGNSVVDGDTFDIVNNLTDGGEEDALSAEMGKKLNDIMPKVYGTNAGDFFIIDEQHNAIVAFTNGNIRTLNFDSASVNAAIAAIQEAIRGIGDESGVKILDDNDAAFDISDSNGNVIMRITKSGQIKTKMFDSETIDVFRQTKLDEPQCICHGYGAATGQANTIPYYRDGYSKGYRFFEVDAINCSDGVPVCTHDNNNGLTVYDKENHAATNVSITSVNGTRTIQMSSEDLVGGYTWDAAGSVPIALLSDVIWQICYFYRCPLQVDGQGLNKASRLAASQYAESLGVGQYVFHELKSGGYNDWSIPCNAIISATSTADIATDVSNYKKPNNNIIFHVDKTSIVDTQSDEFLASLAAAAHSAGCYIMSATYSNLSDIRRLFKCGFDFLTTSGKVNSQV